MARIKAYENKELFIIFLPVLIFSSSPKLNFFIKTPVPTATAAAGVASFMSHFSISEKAELSFVTNFGSPKAMTGDKEKIINKIKNINSIFLYINPPIIII